ncbi:hypothetical protein P8452_75230 [Trifolium repens]|nr:hypothetical protein P8452_75230 [Trifolium repens]
MMFVPWLEKLLAITTFFTACEVHSDESKIECNKFWCIDCYENALCQSCITTSHKGHRVIQIRRLSYNEAIKTIEIYKHVDILGIQTYLINNSTAVFINKRPLPQPKNNKNGKNGYTSISCCKTCKRNLVDSSYFCSLACKFAYIKKNGGFFVSAKEMEEMKRLIEESIKESPPKERAKKLREQNLKLKVDESRIDEEYEDDEEKEEKEEDNKEENQDNRESVLPVTRPSASFRKPNSRRKGIPHRAPFY